jgi:hypothetical protein
LVFVSHREWIKPSEIPWIGGAAMFWTIGWILAPLIPIVRLRYPTLQAAVPISIGMIVPMIAAMVFGLAYVRKKVLQRANGINTITTKTRARTSTQTGSKH